MKKRWLILAAVALMLLSGCSGKDGGETLPPETTVPAPTVPADGNMADVTCKGTYTGTPEMEKLAAKAGEGKLTNGQLQAWYWAAVASYRNAGHETGPDFDAPLDSQPCQIDDSVNSWQQYFLRQALDNWHTAQALDTYGMENGLPLEKEFDPSNPYREENLEGIPAVRYLYGANESFTPNTMHQAFLDQIPQMLEQIAREQGFADRTEMARMAYGTTKEDLTAMVTLLNRGYMYAADRSYYVEVSDQETEDWFQENREEYAKLGIGEDSGYYVDFRQILVLPERTEKHPGMNVDIDETGKVTCDEILWEDCRVRTDEIIRKWTRHNRSLAESSFSELANFNSADLGSAADGGAYRQVRKGQMIQPIDEWIFDESREPGDYTVIRSDYGCHILYFSGRTPVWQAQCREDLTRMKQQELIRKAKEECYLMVDYPAINLTQAQGAADMDRLLYEDVGHERFPEVPIYLQQDYPDVMYGAYPIRTHGCGVTSLAMLASYMLDDEITPPELCEKYGRYNTEDGTDVTLFLYEPAAMGFYNYVTRKNEDAKQAMETGHMLISLQHAGYWTSGGHYIVIETVNDDGTVQVRDSNLFNYGKLQGHKEDRHQWKDVTAANQVFWICEEKLTHIMACSRCGDGAETMLREDYLCHKCRPALMRRNTYLTAME